jgi:hypothetical protein
MTKRLQTVDDVIDALGGHKTPAANNKAVARWLGLNTSAVCNWRDRKSIPSGWHLRFYLEAAKRGLEIGPVVFGIEDGPLPKQPLAKRRVSKKKHTARRPRSGVEFEAA